MVVMLMAIDNEEIDNVTLKQASQFFKHDYHDRGMIKWQGYYLSDHTEHVNKIAHEVKHANQRVRKPEMAPELIAKILFEAYAKQDTVTIQLNTQSEQGIIPPMITGVVKGYTDEAIVIGTQFVPQTNLWWVSKMPPTTQ